MRILVVDDNPDIADALVQVLAVSLRRLAHVEQASNGAEGLALVLSGTTNVVILDLEMPVMGGMEAAAAIRRALGERAPLLIGVSGNSAALASDLARMIFDHRLVKPVDCDTLVALIEAVADPVDAISG